MRQSHIRLLALAMLTVAAISPAAAIDCTRAKGNVETAICTHRR
jgi:uncharacterized protein